MKHLKCKNFVGILTLLCMLIMPVYGDTLIKNVVISGNRRIETSAIKSILDIQAGQTVNQEALDKNLKKLYATEYFTDINISLHNQILVIAVVENPSINQVAFEGNKNVMDHILEKEVKLQPRNLLTKTKVQNEVQRILAIYRSKGYFNAKVVSKIIKKDQNRADVVFEIDEGPVAEIRKIKFIGNANFSDDKLRHVLITKEAHWYRFFATDDVYDPERLNTDRDNLWKFYINKGYADFRVVSAQVEMAPDHEGFVISFTLEEGERYKFGDIAIQNNIPGLDAHDLKEKLKSQKDKWFSAEIVEKDTEKLTEEAGNLGYAFVRIEPIHNKDEATKTVNISYNIDQGPRVYIRDIEITGNTRTVDSVIRRQFKFVEGDAFNTSKIKTSDRNLENLDFFKTTDIQKIPVPNEPDKIDLKLKVEEKSTGEINFNVGFSTAEGPLGMIRLQERNLLGRAYIFSSEFRATRRSKDANVMFANPYFLNRDLEAGVGISRSKRDNEDISSFTQNTIGANTWLGYSLSEYWGQSLNYSLTQEKIGGVKPGAFRDIKEQQGRHLSSVIGQTLAYDRRNYRYAPTSGYVTRLKNSLAGLGGTTKYHQHTLSGGYYYPLTEDVTFSLESQIAAIFPYAGKKIRITDKFFLGGTDLRGFENIGPRAKTGDLDFLGGDRMFSTKAEVSFPLGLPTESGIKGYVFMDAGTTWDTKQKAPDVYNSRALRYAPGVGVGWASPFGLIRLDFGFAMNKKPGDSPQVFMLNFGASNF
jgi:outer membrane protein insertion porin family